LPIAIGGGLCYNDNILKRKEAETLMNRSGNVFYAEYRFYGFIYYYGKVSEGLAETRCA
jgi:hypothetical protein